MANEVSRNEFEDLIEVTAKVMLKCVSTLNILMEEIVKSANQIQSLRKLYCRKCKEFFPWSVAGETNTLTIPCPKCGGPLIPARNIKFSEIEKERTGEST